MKNVVKLGLIPKSGEKVLPTLSVVSLFFNKTSVGNSSLSDETVNIGLGYPKKIRK